MSAVDELVLAPVENIFAKMGMMTGSAAPLKRGLFGAALGGGIVYGVKPEIMFDANGDPRPWIVTNPDAKNATVFPWWAGVITPALIFSVFV